MYPAVCSIKYQEAFNRTTEANNTQCQKIFSFLCIQWFPVCCPFAFHQNQGITALTYSLPPTTKILSHRARSHLYLLYAGQPSVKNDLLISALCHRRAPLGTAAQTVLTSRHCLPQGISSRNISGTKTFMIRWKSSGHYRLVERFRC